MKRFSFLACSLGVVLLVSGCKTCSCCGTDKKAQMDAPAQVATSTSLTPVVAGWTVVLPGDNL